MTNYRTLNPQRGFTPLYSGAQTRCPGCSRSNWYVHRESAECAFCGAALPIAAERVAAQMWGR